MNRKNIEEDWSEISEKLVGRFTKLRNIDMSFIKGREEELLVRIETRLEKTRADLLRLIGTL